MSKFVGILFAVYAASVGSVGSIASYSFRRKRDIERAERPPNYQITSTYKEKVVSTDSYINLYASINWATSCIGGSYALFMYMETLTGDRTLKFDDIDIFVKCKNKREFNRELASFVKKFEEKEGDNLIKPSIFDFLGRIREIFAYRSDPEMCEFNSMILYTKEYQFKSQSRNYPVTIQFIGVDSSNANSNTSIQEMMVHIYDYPACVTMQVVDDEIIYTFPVCMVDMLRRKQVPAKYMCLGRRIKYKEYGFEFTY